MIYHGQIISCDEKNSLYSYLVEENGRIAYLGDRLPDQYAGAHVTEIMGALMPSFVDTHIHFSSYAVFSATIDIKSAASHEEMAEILLEKPVKVESTAIEEMLEEARRFLK